jgi:hypothetical protein
MVKWLKNVPDRRPGALKEKKSDSMRYFGMRIKCPVYSSKGQGFK